MLLRSRILLGLLALLFTLGPGQAEEIEITISGGVYHVPVIINGTLKLDFCLDSGASGVHITPDVLQTLKRSGTVSEEHLQEETKTYVLADGREVREKTVLLQEVRIGSVVLEDVEASVSDNLESSLLLGQSFLARLPAWSIDNSRSLLILQSQDDPIVQKTFWRKNKEFSVEAGSDWRVKEEEDYAFYITDGQATFGVLEAEEDVELADLSKNFHSEIIEDKEWKFLGKESLEVQDAVAESPVTAVLSEYQKDEVRMLTGTFRYLGWSYTVLAFWNTESWDGYGEEMREMFKSIRLHWEAE